MPPPPSNSSLLIASPCWPLSPALQNRADFIFQPAGPQCLERLPFVPCCFSLCASKDRTPVSINWNQSRPSPANYSGVVEGVSWIQTLCCLYIGLTALRGRWVSADRKQDEEGTCIDSKWEGGAVGDVGLGIGIHSGSRVLALQ